jgi:deoxyribose-phosphate aldolase
MSEMGMGNDTQGLIRRVVEQIARQIGEDPLRFVTAGSSDSSAEARSGGRSLASLIDHTLLRADATRGDLEQLCQEALEHGFAAVCVNGANVPLCIDRVGGRITVCTVVGFPLGAASSVVKAFEAQEAVREGATEIDMVVNLGLLKQGDHARVRQDIRAVVEASGPADVKVIIETGALSDEQKVAACLLSAAAGARFVKTSTGFGPGGATCEDVALMREVVGVSMGVKASAGIRTREAAEALIGAGADRLGTSAGPAIVSR